jgi:hypothetical protein
MAVHSALEIGMGSSFERHSPSENCSLFCNVPSIIGTLLRLDQNSLAFSMDFVVLKNWHGF